jgi:hypothetical protein
MRKRGEDKRRRTRTKGGWMSERTNMVATPRHSPKELNKRVDNMIIYGAARSHRSIPVGGEVVINVIIAL